MSTKVSELVSKLTPVEFDELCSAYVEKRKQQRRIDKAKDMIKDLRDYCTAYGLSIMVMSQETIPVYLQDGFNCELMIDSSVVVPARTAIPVLDAPKKLSMSKLYKKK